MCQKWIFPSGLRESGRKTRRKARKLSSCDGYTPPLSSLYSTQDLSLSFFCWLPIKFHLFSGCWKVPQQHELTLVYLLVRQIKVANERESCVCCPSSEMMANRAYQFRLVKKLTLSLWYERQLFSMDSKVLESTHPFLLTFLKYDYHFLRTFAAGITRVYMHPHFLRLQYS